MRVHLVDGTYELFRQHFGQVSRHSDSHPFAAAAGVVSSTLALVADGATHMMLKEHKKILGEKTARSLMKQLRATQLNAWPRYWQDAAFSTVYNWESPGSGARHWAGGRWHC